MTIERLRAKWFRPDYCPYGGHCKTTDTIADFSGYRVLAPVGSECTWLSFALTMDPLEEIGTFSVGELRELLKKALAYNAELSAWATTQLKATVPLDCCYIGKNLYDIKLLKDALMYQDSDTKFVISVIHTSMHLLSDKLHIYVTHKNMEEMQITYGNRGYRAL